MTADRTTANSRPIESKDARALVIAELIRRHGPAKVAALIKLANAAHAEGRAPDYAAVLVPKEEKQP